MRQVGQQVASRVERVTPINAKHQRLEGCILMKTVPEITTGIFLKSIQQQALNSKHIKL